MKNLFFIFTLLLGLSFFSVAHADYATTPQPVPQPQPLHYGAYPYPAPAPYPVFPVPAAHVTCFAQGLANGALYYGVGYNIYAANQWALYACNSSGQYCQLVGCRYY
ncbi:MAG: hypothetical protein ACAH59_01745 [Pseudobdellovibrionaceae bacterium]